MHRSLTLALAGAGLVAASAATPALANYKTVADYEALTDGETPGFGQPRLSGIASVDGTLLAMVADNAGNAGKVTKGPAFDPLVTNGQLALDPNASTSGFEASTKLGAVGSDLLFADRITQSVYTVDTQSGDITQRVTTARIRNQTGDTNSQINNQTITSTNNLVWYDGSADTILQTNRTGSSLSTLMSTTQLQNQTGALTVDSMSSGGGRVYIANDDVDVNEAPGNNPTRLFSFDPNAANPASTVNPVLDVQTLSSVTGLSEGMTIDNMLYGSDDWVYFRERDSGSLYKFDPTDPSSSLTTVLTESELNDGPSSATLLNGLVWHDDQLHWWHANDNSFLDPPARAGLYTIPEPASLTLLGASGLVVCLGRRRRRA